MLHPEYVDYIQQFLTPDRLARFDEILAQRTRAVTVVLENLYHTHNASACLRNCEAFGVQDVHVIENTYDYEPARAIDRGAAQWLTLHRYASEGRESVTRECLRELKGQGYRIVATCPHAEAYTPSTLPLAERTAVVFGGEKVGISPAVAEEADAFLTIPMHGFVESFNVSVAVALSLQRIVERVRDQRSDWGLSDAERAELRDLWSHRTARKLFPRLVQQYRKEHPERVPEE